MRNRNWFLLLPYIAIVTMVVFPACQPNAYLQGKQIYRGNCGNCHMDDGSGLAHLIPPLDSVLFSQKTAGDMVCLIRHGLPVNTKTGQQMPANTELSDTEMANLLNYLGFTYKGLKQWVKANEIKGLSTTCQPR